MSDEAVLDAAVDAGADPSTDLSTDVATETADASVPTDTETDGAEEPGTADPDQKVLVQDGKFRGDAKALFDRLKSGTPEEKRLAQQLQQAVMRADRYQRDFPTGTKQFQELQSQVEQFGGLEAIEQQAREIGYWDGIDKMFSDADPKLVEALTDTPRGVEAFNRLAPSLANKWADSNPEGFTAFFAQAFLGDLQGSGIPLALERLADFLPQDNPRALAAWNQIAGYLQRVQGMAGKPLAPAKQAQPQDDTRERELSSREERLTRTEWKGQADRQLGQHYAAEWRKQVGDRKLSDDSQAAVNALFHKKLGELLTADGFEEKAERFFATKQMDGFLRLHSATFAKRVPEALRFAVRAMNIGGKPGPKPGTQARPGVKPAPAAKPAPANGFIRISQKPSMDQVNRVQTSAQMWTKNQAILRDGKRVTWA